MDLSWSVVDGLDFYDVIGFGSGEYFVVFDVDVDVVVVEY